MKMADCRVGMKVYDRWFAGWASGTIVKILKTRIKVYVGRPFAENGFAENGIVTYDKAHCQFLEEEPRRTTKRKNK